MINRLISLTTIKRSINQFPLKSSIVGSWRAQPDDIFYTNLYKDYYLFSLGTTKQIDPLYSTKSKISRNISINDYLYITQKDPYFKGFGDLTKLDEYIYYDLVYKLINYGADVNNSLQKLELNHTKFKYHNSNPFVLDNSMLYLFTRLVPKSVLDRDCMTLNSNNYRLYNLYDRSCKDMHTTFGFISKFDGNYNIKVNDRYKSNNIYSIKFPTLTHKLVDNRLFDGNKFNYVMQKSLLYIENNKLLDKHNIEVIDDF